ncbi:MAG: cyanophycinase [Bacteroidota bacterium]
MNLKSGESNKGVLILIGGAEDKKDDKIILKKIVSLSTTRKVVVVPTASEYPDAAADNYLYAFRDLGVETVHVFNIRERSEADTADNFTKLEESDVIFFTGGDQVRLVKTLNGTELISRIKERHLNNKLHIAGTSAGAAAASNPLIFDGDYQGLIKGSINFGKGFGFIEKVTIDTHFVNRGRLGRLTQFLCTGQSTRGIGLGEDTSVFVYPDNTFEVVGSGMVTLVNTDYVTYTNYNQIPENSPIVINGILTGFLQQGTFFDLKKWEVIADETNKSGESKEINANIHYIR